MNILTNLKFRHLLSLSSLVKAFLYGLMVSLSVARAADIPLNEASFDASTQLRIQQHTLQTEIADTQAKRAKGLMLRTTLSDNAGMLFVFPDEQIRCFWMKNTLIPLSIAYIDNQGKILEIADMFPLNENSICSRQEVRFALEVNQHWFRKHGITVGDYIYQVMP